MSILRWAMIASVLTVAATGAWLAASPSPLGRALHWWSSSALLAISLWCLLGDWVRKTDGRVVLAWLGGAATALGAFFLGRLSLGDAHALASWMHVRSGASLLGVDLPATVPTFALLLHTTLIVPVAATGLLAWRRVPHGRRAGWLAAVATVLLIVLLSMTVSAPAKGVAVEGAPAPDADWPFAWLSRLETSVGPIGLLALPVALAAFALLVVGGRPRTASKRAALAMGGLVLGLLASVVW